MKVLLIQPPLRSKKGLQAYILSEPLGLETVAGSLIGDHQVEILDARIERNIKGKLASFRPDAVGVAASFTSTVYSAFEALAAAKDYNPGTLTFVGGNHATLWHQDFAGRADVSVLGEGELIVPDLLRSWEQGKDLGDVPGIAYQGRNGWRESNSRPQIQNLDLSPLPARHLVAKYQGDYFQGSWRPCRQVETSRGCQYQCKFCSVWRFHRGSVRMRSPEWVIRELKQITTPYVFFVDDNFLVSPPRAKKICEAIRESGIKKNYQIQARSDTIVKHPELLQEFGKIGLKTVFIGFESVTDEGLKALDKRNSLECNEEAIRILKGMGIGIMSSFIVDPGYNRQEFAVMRRYIHDKKPPMPIFWVLTPIPGTVLHQERHLEMTSDNYDLFDGFHAVLPPRLGLRRFYWQYFRLWSDVYLKYPLPVLLARKTAGKSPLSFIKKLIITLLLLKDFNPWSLWKHHARHPSKVQPSLKLNIAREKAGP